jgi:hypothetical protein
MIKKLGWFSIPLIILIALVFLWLMKPVFLSSYLTSKLGVPVSVGSLSISPSQTVMKGFRIKNPYHYKTKSAFKAEKTQVDYQFSHLFGTPTQIALLSLQDVFLSVEFDNPGGTKNNWTKILSEIPAPVHTQKEIVLHRITIDNLTVELRGLGLAGTQRRTVDHIELDEIDSKNGFPTKELVGKIFGGAGIQDYIKDILNPTNTIKDLLTPFSENEVEIIK